MLQLCAFWAYRDANIGDREEGRKGGKEGMKEGTGREKEREDGGERERGGKEGEGGSPQHGNILNSAFLPLLSPSLVSVGS